MSAGELTYTSQIDFLEAIFSQAAGDDFDAISGGYAKLSQVKDTVHRFLATAREKRQEDRIGKLEQMEQRLNALSSGLKASSDDQVLLFRGSTLSKSRALLSSSTSSYRSEPVPEAVASSGEDLSDPLFSAPYSCPVCFEEVPLRQTVVLLACKEDHRLCRGCMKTYLDTQINDNQVERISCPHPGCGALADYSDIQPIVAPDIYDKYLGFVVMAVVQSEVALRFCPNEQCSHPIILEDMCRQAEILACPSCKCDFCSECGKRAHPGTDCAGAALPDGEQLFQAWLLGRGAQVKPCFHCQALTEKNDGCNHMTCRHCRGQWCWLCGEAYTGTHFSEGECEGLQFSNVDSIEVIRERRRRRAEWDSLSEEERGRRAREELQQAMVRRRAQIQEYEESGVLPQALAVLLR